MKSSTGEASRFDLDFARDFDLGGGGLSESESDSDEESCFLLLLRFFFLRESSSDSDSEPLSSELSFDRRFFDVFDFFLFFLFSSLSFPLSSLPESLSYFFRFFDLFLDSFDLDFDRLLLPSSESESLSSDEGSVFLFFFFRLDPSSTRFRFFPLTFSSLELPSSLSSSADSHRVAPRAGTYQKVYISGILPTEAC